MLREWTATTQEKYLYTQHERDKETGLDYAGARFYDSGLGRFTGVDPMAEKYLQWSPFHYSGNNPISNIDENGMEWSEANKELANQYGLFGNGGETYDSFNDDEYLRYKNANGNWETRKISDKGGFYVDIVHTQHGNIPEEGSYVTTEVKESEKSKQLRMQADDIAMEKGLESIDFSDFIPTKGAMKGVLVAGIGFSLKKLGANTATSVSGWVKRSEFNALDNAIQKKVASAINNGIVSPTGRQGIIRLTASEAAETGYQYKVKILGNGGDIRIYGNAMENGHIFFDKIMRH